MAARHRKQDKRSPSEESDKEDPSEGLTRLKLVAKDVTPWLVPLLTIIDWLVNR